VNNGSAGDDVLLHPNFSGRRNLRSYKARMKPALMQQRSQPNFLANQALSRAFMANIRRGCVGYAGVARFADASELADWHEKHYAPRTPFCDFGRRPRLDTDPASAAKWLAEWQRSKHP